MIRKIVSGGQTGVDRAALDVALERNIPCAGWCPLGRRAEDGPLPDRYPLRETESGDYRQRTAWNVRDSDATLILNQGELVGGTALTRECAESCNRPCLVLTLGDADTVDSARQWLAKHGVRVLNIAGPRESKRPGIYRSAVSFLDRLLTGEEVQ
jgi:hypothetical protein